VSQKPVPCSLSANLTRNKAIELDQASDTSWHSSHTPTNSKIATDPKEKQQKRSKHTAISQPKDGDCC